MYNAQTTISKVQKEIKRKNDTQKHMLEECGLSINMLKQMSDRNGIASFSLAKIADYLDVSVDYLLGRTDNPQAHKVSTVSVGNVSNNSGIIGGIGNNAPISINDSNSGECTDEQLKTLVGFYGKLDPLGKAELLLKAAEIAKKDK